MVTGTFIEKTPFIEVTIAGKNAVRSSFFILDTGFTGDIQVTSKIVSELNLKTLGIVSIHIADGSIIEVPAASAFASMEDSYNSVEVLISESLPLVGISFLTKFGYTAHVDCLHKTINLNKSY